MTSSELRQRAEVHRTIHASRTLALAGTAEGAAKGWESRKKGGGAAATVVKRPVPAPVVRQALTGTIGAMPAAERAALDAGYQSAKKKGFTGGQDEFLAEQAALYEHAPEGDPRFETWLSGETLDRLKADAGAKGLVDVLAANQKVPVATPAAPAAPTPEAQPEAPAPEAQPAPVAVVRPAQTIAQSRVPVTQAWANALAKGKQGLAGVKRRGDRLTGEQARAQARAQKIATAKSSHDLRRLADVHRTIHANRVFALEGTSEGATKGWETRKHGEAGEPAKPTDAPRKKGALHPNDPRSAALKQNRERFETKWPYGPEIAAFEEKHGEEALSYDMEHFWANQERRGGGPSEKFQREVLDAGHKRMKTEHTAQKKAEKAEARPKLQAQMKDKYGYDIGDEVFDKETGTRGKVEWGRDGQPHVKSAMGKHLVGSRWEKSGRKA